jgi:hypothetical protein
VREAGERAGRQAAERQQLALASQCVVPRIVGDRLRAARRALRASHCRLGRVIGVARDRRRSVVLTQGSPVGNRLAGGASVSVRVGRSLRHAQHG